MYSMKEIVDRILQEEQSARSRIAHAQSQADAIILKARDESKSLIEDAVERGEKEAAQKKKECENQSLADKEKILKETREKASLSRNQREKDIPNIAHKVFSQVLTIKD